MSKMFDIVVAADKQLGIGKNGDLPWRLPLDLRHFKEITSAAAADGQQNAVIMGRKTWESIPEKRRPLPGRLNVVLTRDDSYQLPDGVIRCNSLDDALLQLDKNSISQCFVIGGGEIYRQALHHRQCRDVYLTDVEAEFDCDTVLPALNPDFELISSSDEHCENGIKFRFKVLRRKSGDCSVSGNI